MGNASSKITTKPLKLSDIKGISLRDSFQTSKSILSETLWQSSPALIMLVRRPGCAFCIEQVLELAKYAALIQKDYGVKIVAICHERLGVDKFVNNYWNFGGEIWIDEDLDFFKAIGGGEIKQLSLLSLMNFKTISKYKNMNGKGKGNFEGNGRILGGFVIVGKSNDGVLYSHLESLSDEKVAAKEAVEFIQNNMKRLYHNEKDTEK